MNTSEAIFFYLIGLLIFGIALGTANDATYGWTVIGAGIMGISGIIMILNFILSVMKKGKKG